MTEELTHTAFLGIGSNMDNREAMLAKALCGISEFAGKVELESGIYETAAWGITNQQSFLNQVLKINTPLLPQNLMNEILEIERKIGRIREEKWGPRLIDIDILFYENQIINTVQLQIPHPQLQLRKFVLVPMVEIAANFVHPVFQKTMNQLLAECPDKLEIKVYNAN